MAINYSKVGWNSGSYLGPTNFNHMDDGIKAACDQADENAADIISINESLAKLAIATHNPTVYSANFSGSITLYRQGRIAFGNIYLTAAQALAVSSAYALMATITDPAFYPSENTLVRGFYNSSANGQIRAIKSLTSGGTTYTNQIIIGHTGSATIASGAIVSFPIMYVCDGD